MEPRDDVFLSSTDSDSEIEIVDLAEKLDTSRGSNIRRSTLEARLSPRQRLIRTAAMLSAFVLLLSILWGSYAPIRNVLLTTINTYSPPPLATIPLGTDRFYVDANPSWGKLVLDGHLIMHVPQLQVDTPLHLSRGLHHLQWSAAPFLPQQCVVTVPPNYLHDTCYSDEIVGSPIGNARFFRFPASLGMLTDAQSQELVSVIQTTLDAQAPTTIIERGTAYAADIGPSQVAQQSLKAAFHFQLDVNIHSGAYCSSYTGSNSGCIYNQQDCRTLCSATDLIVPSLNEANTWVVLSAIQPSWDYTTLAGVVVARNQPDIVNGAGNDDFLPLKITWDGTHWHVANDFAALTPEAKTAFDPVCNDAQQHQRIDTSLSYVEQVHAGTTWQYVSDSNWADGCLAVVSLDTSTMLATPSTTPPVALCLHRFGTFVAVNAMAQQYWPTMPRATAAEQQIAQHLVSLYHSNN